MARAAVPSAWVLVAAVFAAGCSPTPASTPTPDTPEAGPDASEAAAPTGHDAGVDASALADAPGGLDAPDAVTESGADASTPGGTTFINADPAMNQLTRFDVDGNAIDAHDGALYLFDGTYYLYGTS